MELELTVAQRLILAQILNEVRGDLRTYRKGLKLLDLFELTGDEQKAIDLRTVTVDDAGRPMLVWREPEQPYRIAVADDNLAAFLCEQATAFTGWAVLDRGATDGLLQQLGLGGDG